MKDLYVILEVAKNATADEIKKTYRTLAKKYHPDLHPGDKQAEVNMSAALDTPSRLGWTLASGKLDSCVAEVGH